MITTISRGGAEKQLLTLAAEQIKLGYNVSVIYLKGDPELKDEFEQVGVTVHHEVALVSPALQPFLLKKFTSGTVVHAHLPRAELICFFTPSKFRLIVSRHNSEAFFPKAPRFISNLLSNLVVLRAARVIAISEAVKDFLIHRGEVAKFGKISVIPYGYTRQSLNRPALELSKTSIQKLGTISRLTEQKDIPTMLRAFLEILDHHPDCTLSIVGGGPLEYQLKELTDKLGLSERVFFLGRSSKVTEFLNEIDVFLLTSVYEGFGLVLLEAMDAGIPIVAANNSAIPEVLGSCFPGLCETGNYKDFAKKIEKLEELDYRKIVLTQQYDRLEIFKSAPMAIKISQVYSS